MMATHKTDIVIIGAGMAGASLALLLTQYLPDVSVTVIESFAVNKNPAPASFRPSFDARSTALSQSSRDIFSHMGVWETLSPHMTAIEKIHVSDQGHIGSTALSASEQQLAALGFVVENQWLGQVLMAAVQAQPRINIISPAKPETIQLNKNHILVGLSDSQSLTAQLLVVADGANSQTRSLLGIEHRQQSYGQMAIITNMRFSEPHENRAFERFTANGPLALLPLEPFEGLARSALVWTMPPEQCQQLMAADEKTFLEQLQQCFGYRLGKFLKVGERHSYPLQLITSDELVRRRIALVGNAASSLHPVAGQGFNLALRGLDELAKQLSIAHQQSLSLGDLSALQAYANAHNKDRQATILFSDILPKVFGSHSPPIAFGRNLSLLAMDAMPSLRGAFSRFGTGLQPGQSL